MNKKPFTYTQFDPRWGKLSYATQGENSTICDSGCGPTCAAMLLTTLKGQEITPVDTCRWAVEHGYKAPHQGTYHSYFIPQFQAYGIECKQLNSVSVYDKPDNSVHGKAMNFLKDGWYLIALMGEGLWTRGGHYIVVWWSDNKIRINDPASTKNARLNGDPAIFFKQVKHYWAVNPRIYNGREEDDDMTDEAFAQKMQAYLNNLSKQPPAAWSDKERQVVEAAGLLIGGDAKQMHYQSFVTRETLAVVLSRLLTYINAKNMTD